MSQLQTLAQAICLDTHSSIRLAAEGLVIRVDPFRVPDAPHDADLIFVTHDHFDHYSPEDVEKVRKPDTVFVAPRSTAALIEKAFPGHACCAVGPDEPGTVCGVRFETVRAYNPQKPFHPRANDWVGYVLTLSGLHVYIAGDTDRTPEAEAVRCEIALVPIGGHYTMDPAEAAALVNTIRPQLAIPTHYGSVAGSPSCYGDFAARVDPAIRVEARL